MSFLEGIDLSGAAERAIRADLELRRKDPRVADRFFRYRYVGGADLCLQHGRSWKGRVRPARYDELAGRPGDCYGSALRACLADDSLTYCEGYCTVSAGLPFSHGWAIERETGEVVDLVLPCGADQLDVRLHPKTLLPVLHPTRWAYFGVMFTTKLVRDHDRKLGLPMLDRSFAENYEILTDRADPSDYIETHDNPILKVPFDPMRASLDGIPYNSHVHIDMEDDDDDTP